MSLVLMYITNSPEVALIAQEAGVDRIWIDLETLGKAERQKNQESVKSRHCINDIRVIAPLLGKSRMLVRVNPLNPGSEEEIEAVISAGAGLVMLPMWKTPDEVARFVSLVHGRAKTVLLLETKEAVECLDEVLSQPGIDEIHIGLNDLHLSYGMSFMFELVANGTVEMLCNKIRNHGLPYGFGGIARLGQGMIPAEMVICEHYRLGSTRAILSRSFCNTTDGCYKPEEIRRLFTEEMAKLRAYEQECRKMQPEAYEENRRCFAEKVNQIVGAIASGGGK